MNQVMMNDGIDIRRRRLFFRAWHRGMKEVDLIMGNFASRYLAVMDDAELTCFEALLDIADHDLFLWITGRAPIPKEHNSFLLDRICRFQLDGVSETPHFRVTGLPSCREP